MDVFLAKEYLRRGVGKVAFALMKPTIPSSIPGISKMVDVAKVSRQRCWLELGQQRLHVYRSSTG